MGFKNNKETKKEKRKKIKHHTVNDTDTPG